MKSNQQVLPLWAERMLGAKMLLQLLQQRNVNLFPEMRKEGMIYSKALYECLLDSREMDNFLSGGEIRFSDHQRDKNNKLTSCKAHII